MLLTRKTLRFTPATSAAVQRAFMRGVASASTATDKYDVVIAGGGVMGCSTAYHLASTTDLKIAVLERDPTYKRASATLSAGGIRHQFSERANILLSQYGSEFLRSVGTRLRVDETQDEPDIQFVEGGYLFLATEKGRPVLEANHKTQLDVNARVEMLTPEQLKSKFPWLSTDGVVAGTLGMEDQGWFDPWSYLTALKRKAVSLGVDVIQGEVKAFDLDDATKRIERVHFDQKDGGSVVRKSLTVDKVVNAAGPWASKLLEACGSFDYPVKPRKRSVFVYRCPHEETWKGPSASPLVVDPTGVYFRREGSGGQFLCGVSPEESQDPDGKSDDELDCPDHDLFENYIWPVIAERVPKFEAIKLVNAWAGWYEYNTFDQNAIIGIHPDVPNMYLVNGFSGHGLQQSPGAGRAVAELISEGAFVTVDASCFHFERVRENKPFLEKNIV